MVYLTRKCEFSASHIYHNPDFTPEQNRTVFGKCNNPNGHGHNYAIEVTVSGEVDRSTGMVCNLVDLDEMVRELIVKPFDHQDLNHKTEFQNLVPTTENLAIVVFNILKPHFTFAHLDKVRI